MAGIACHDGDALGDGIGQDEFHGSMRLNRGEKLQLQQQQ